ncbi:MAG: HAMP domain-containing sensor histidine kinase, partial [Prolixibacteraceae bacterium]|nr:HAMP domain-containing sensor histidine kinase [Prolixibacteraceae bacterium]
EDIYQIKNFDLIHSEINIQIKQQLGRLLDYNNKLYNWTKLSFDSLELNISDVSLDLMVANLNGQYDGRLNEKSIKLLLNVDKQVDLKTDYVLLNQVVVNLLDNAIKFSKENSEIKIEVNQHSLKLSDSGVGMSTEKIDEILNGYSLKSSNGTKGEPGTGLGLNIVTRIIHALNFKLNIESELGKGSTFTITFN